MNSSFDGIEKIYGTNNKSDLARVFNKQNLFDPKYSTMTSKGRKLNWNGQDIST